MQSVMLPNIDEVATKKNVKKVLKNCRRLKNVLRDSSQKVTASYSFEVRQKQGASKGQLEKLAIERADIISEVGEVETALNSLSRTEYKLIIQERFLKLNPEKVEFLASSIGYSRGQFHVFQHLALLEFAEHYRHGACLVFEV